MNPQRDPESDDIPREHGRATTTPRDIEQNADAVEEPDDTVTSPAVLEREESANPHPGGETITTP